MDSDSSGEYADLDTEGRYLVRVPFSKQNGANGAGKDKRTNRIRFATPFSGQDSGMYLPLRKDTEVLLSFAGGDPDRPAITAAAANSAKPSLVTQQNETRNVLRTGSGNLIEMEDTSDRQQIRLLAPLQNTAISIGAPVGVLENLIGLATAVAASSSGSNTDSTSSTKSPPPANLQLYTDGTTLHHTGNYSRLEVGKKAKTADYAETATPGDGDLFGVLLGEVKDGASPGSLVLVIGKDEIHKILKGGSLTSVGRSDVKAPAPGEHTVAAAGNISLNAAETLNLTCKNQNVTVLDKSVYTALGYTWSIRSGATNDIFMGNQFSMSLGALERIFVAPRFSLFFLPKLDIHLGTKNEFNIQKGEMNAFVHKFVWGAEVAAKTVNVKTGATRVGNFLSNVGNAVVEACAAMARTNNYGIWAAMGGMTMFG